ncbi:hypothetical protein L1987_05621 [Smallanthus sonchifolius]|uniref:Uncharacterized protein n=1 Tax=Smallanthus sonchifolius TaxID=185202 RepID=A0ACB9JVU5_9ASTR|nr:hypothetical protein L1987_05621 [Smallanthus sonchifolius]
MQRLLPIGVRPGLHKNVSTTINDVCTFFQKICARSVDVKDMYEANEEVVKILCNLEMIYPLAFFDIMVHLILHLPEEAILGGPVYMRWMYTFERYMKKLKAYVRNKAKPEGSIAEGYVADGNNGAITRWRRGFVSLRLGLCDWIWWGSQKRRSKGKNLKLYKKFERNGRKPLPIDVKLHGGVVSPYYPNWAMVPNEKKQAVYPTLIDYFDLDSWRNTDKWRGVELGITAECQRAYKDHKRELKVHLEENGGYDDVEAAMNNPPEDLDQETWETLISELFLDASYKNRSEKNKQNRSQQRYPSYHGSKSYAQRRHMEGTDPIDVFKSTHYKEGTGWANTNASLDYDRIEEEYTRSSAESGGDSSAVDEFTSMEHALGHRRGHIRGVGRVVTLGNRNSPAFISSLRNFIETAKNHVDGRGRAFCPCRRCCNACRQDLNTIYGHIHDRGFLQSYQNWIYHGEQHPRVAEIALLFAPRITPTPPITTTTNNEMFDAIYDVMAEQNINKDNIDEDGTGLDPEFDALFEELNKELYPGCS